MRFSNFVLGLLVILCGNAFGADLHDIIAHPKKYYGQRVVIVGIARVPGDFYLFDDISAAAERDTSKALFVIQRPSLGDTRGLDRKLVRITGLLSASTHDSQDAPCEIEPDQVEVLNNIPDSRIKDPVVYGVFQNTLPKDVIVELSRDRDSVYAKFTIAAYGSNGTSIEKGRASVFAAQKQGKSRAGNVSKEGLIVSDELKFPQLPPSYVYSPANSDQRTLYYRISKDRIELIPAPQTKQSATQEK